MCSERWQCELDADGHLFVDYSPQVFVPLVDFLRLARDSEPNMPAPVLVDPSYRRAWIRMMLASSFHPKVLRKAGMTPQELRDCGCDPKFLHEAGFSVKELGIQASGPRAKVQFLECEESSRAAKSARPCGGRLLNRRIAELWIHSRTAEKCRVQTALPNRTGFAQQVGCAQSTGVLRAI